MNEYPIDDTFPSVSEKVTISVSNDRAFLWSVRDVEIARRDYHICGSTLGSLPQAAQQNVFLGLPLQLLREEVFVLMKYGLAVMVDDRDTHRHVPDDRELQDYHEARSDAEWEQKFDAWRVAQVRKRLTQMALSKTQNIKLGKDFPLEVQKHLEAMDEGQVPSFPAPTKEEVDVMPHQVEIDTVSDYPWVTRNAHPFVSIKDAEERGVWKYPVGRDLIRCAIFEDLWRRNLFLGPGLKFGCDFLVYSGDPMRYHSHFSLTVVEQPEMQVSPLDIVMYGRLATKVKKAHLLSTVGPNGPMYLSLTWSGMS